MKKKINISVEIKNKMQVFSAYLDFFLWFNLGTVSL